MSAPKNHAARTGRLLTFAAVALAVVVAVFGVSRFLGHPADRGAGAPPCVEGACGDAGRVAAPATLEPASSAAIAQAGVVGAPFARPLAVRVLDASGQPVPGVMVTFGTSPAAEGDGATLSATSATTDAQGYAQVTATANLTPSRGDGYQAWASVGGERHVFSLRNYDPTAAADVRVVDGRPDGALVLRDGRTVSIQVVNAVGAALPGVPVSLARNPGQLGPPGLAFTPESAVTDGKGFATFTATGVTVAGAGALDVRVAGQPLATYAYLLAPVATPAFVHVLSGGDQFAAPSTAFTNPIVFEVDDATNLPVAGASVTITTSAGSAAPSPLNTDAQGRGSVTVTAGAGYGDIAVTIDAGGGVTGTATVTSGDATTRWLRLVDGDQLWGLPSQVFSKPVAVQVVNGLGLPVAGETVNFAIDPLSVGITLGGASAVSGADGKASVSVTAGATLGWNAVNCSMVGGMNTRTIYPSIIGPTGVGYFEVVSGGGQSGYTGADFTNPLVVRLVRYDGTPVIGAKITIATTAAFAANATLTTYAATTDSSGQVSVGVKANNWPGTYTVDFSSTGNEYYPIPRLLQVPFTNLDTAPHGPAAIVAVKSGSGQTAPIGTAFGLPLVALVTDLVGNPVDGVVVAFAAPGSGASASLSASSATTDLYGLASITATANMVRGGYNVTASVTALPSANFTLTNSAPATTTAVTSSLNPSTYGDAVTFTATVSGPSPVPTGSVAFTAGATTLCGLAPLNGAGVATCTYSTLDAGTPTITASYSGDATHDVSTGTIAQTVNMKAQAITFNLPAAATYGDAAVELAPLATGGLSGNPITFAVVSGPGSITGTTLTITGAGDIVVSADQAGNANYTAAPQVQKTLVVAKAAATVTLSALDVTYDGTPKAAGVTTVPTGLAVDVTYAGLATVPTNAGTYAVVATVNEANYQGSNTGTLTIAKAPQVITFTPPGKTYGDVPFDLAASATGGGSGNPVTFALVSGPGTLAGSTLTITGAGAIVVSASQAGNANYLDAATVQATITVAKAAATVTLVAASLNVTYDGLPKAVGVNTTPSGLTVDITYAGSATVPSGAGSYAVVATVNDPNWAGSATGTLTIAKAAQVLNFTQPADRIYGDAPFDLAAYVTGGASTSPIVFAVVSGPGTVAGTFLTITGAGAIVVSASQAGDANYDAATPVERTVTVAKAAATVTLSALSVTYDGTPKAAGVTTVPANLTVDVTYAGLATVPTGAGTYAVVATVNSPNYVGSATGTLTIAKAAQVITFNPPAARSSTDPPLDLAGYATGGGSGNPITFAVVSGPGTLAGSVLTATTSGTVVVSASQAGNANYLAATTVQASIAVGKSPATVTLEPASLSVTYDGLPKPVTVTTSPAGLTVDVTYAGSATVPTGAGSYAVVATVNDPTYAGSASGTLVIAKAAQAITFNPPATRTYGDAAINLASYATGGASTSPLVFTVVSGPGSVTGTTLAITGAGDILVSASQDADGNYTAAIPVERTITVAKATPVVTITPLVTSPVSGQAVGFQIAVTVTGGTATGAVQFLDGATVLAASAALTSGLATVTLTGGLLVGSHALSATYAGDANVLAAAPGTLTYVVAKSPSSVALASSRPGAATNQPVTYTATVAPAGGGGTPTGSVTFKDGAAILGTGSLSGGVATFTVRSLVKGAHAISADYAGDAEFLASSGTLLGGQVVPKSAPVAGSGFAVTFDGMTQDARVEDPTGALDGAMTVELWFKAQPGTGVACLAQQGEGAGLRFGLCLSAARNGFVIRRGAEVANIPATIGTGWHHVALVTDGTGTTLVYDGVEAASLVGTFGTGSHQPFLVAAAPAGADATDRFVGTVDEVRVWSVARPTADLVASARQPVAGDALGLIGLWRFDEGSGGSAFDAAPAHLEATLTASASGSWIASDAWKRRATKEERLLAPFLAGYDPDGDAFTVTLIGAPQNGLASVAGTSVSYMPKDRFLGVDAFTYQLTAGGLSNQFTTEVEVTRIEACVVQADCAGGDTCTNGICVQPKESSNSGCSCTSSGQGAPTALLALLLLALLSHRRSQPGVARRTR